MELFHTIETDWKDILSSRLEKETIKKITDFLEKRYDEAIVYPPQQEIFQALNLTCYADTKVVILGQDPYHGPGQSHGLAFSVRDGVKLPPSLKNILKELQNDLGCELPISGNLTHWAKQGVLMLNTILTVEEKSPGVHKNIGWEQVTDTVIDALNEKNQPIVYILWGKPAQSKIKRINPKHKILTAPHPSPLSSYRGFFGSKPFSQANAFLESHQLLSIDWCLV